jgi:hypothetical protein
MVTVRTFWLTLAVALAAVAVGLTIYSLQLWEAGT